MRRVSCRLCRISRKVSRFRRAIDGMAAMEFAMIAPVLLVMFLGIVEVSDAYLAGRKIEEGINTVADLVSQEQELSFADAQGIETALQQITSPYDITNATYYIVSVVKNDDDEVIVEWSIDENQSPEFVVGSEYTDLANELNLTGVNSILPVGSPVIIAKIDYAFTSALTSHQIGVVSFSKHTMRWPRRSLGVVYCNQANQCSDD